MARTVLAPQDVTLAGITPSYTAASVDGHFIEPGAKGAVLHVKNGSGGSINVTLPTPGDVGGLAIADRIIAVPAAGEKVISLDAAAYAQPTDSGRVYVDFSAVTSVTVALLAP